MKSSLTFFLLFLIFQLSGQKPAGYDQDLRKLYNMSVDLITPQELYTLSAENEDLIVIDTREKEEFKVSHLEGARLVGYNSFTLKTVKDIPKDAVIVVYCSLGVRSEKIGGQLINAGYQNVKNLYGGIFEWVYHDKPILNQQGELTNKVHTYDEKWSKWLIKGEKIY